MRSSFRKFRSSGLADTLDDALDHTALSGDPHPMDLHPYVRHALRAVRSAPAVVIYDTETTGFDRIDAPMPRIWELAAIKRSAAGRVAHTTILNCGIEIPWEANLRRVDPRTPLIHGKPTEIVLARFARFIEGALLVGHNIVSFDNPLMSHAYALAGLPSPIQLSDRRRCVDTVLLARALWPKGTPGAPVNNQLASLGLHLGVEFDAAGLHAALADVTLNELVLDRLLEVASARLGGSRI